MLFRVSLLLVLAALTSACATAPTQPIALQTEFWDTPNQKVGVVISEIPAPDVFLPGAGCLLCVAVAEGNHATLSKNVDTFDTSELQSLPEEIKHKLESKGLEVVVLSEKFSGKALKKIKSSDPQSPKFDYSSFANDSDITHLLVVEIQGLGIHRNYSSYVPVGDPQGWFSALSYMVDLRTNTYAWYKPVQIFKASDIVWDEPPAFPGLTNAYYQALAEGKSTLTNDF
ncbi:hypothetical protein G8764_16890 [Pseudomaricurvus alcaniphilus]|uniref:hypothetical protein n=1 Tax=Pseudomaricurvus alcaniphilus TaxID=1166482 RepID=UPI00140B7253|nr:hypothetical protein [Pseudomaricurvus alcaniphilus]NHN38988.1 hypothetical protein [Pseudomaricurvus alcaniphilus]